MASISARVQLFDSEQSGGHRRQASLAAALSTSSTFSMLVDLLELHFDDFVVGGLHHAPDELGFDGQLAVAAVDQHQQVHARRAAVIEQRIERGADGAARVQHVVHQDDVLAVHRKRNLGGADHRLDVDRAEVVAIEIDVEDADRHCCAFPGLRSSCQPLRQRNAAAADADEGEPIQVLGLFQDFVRQPDQRAVDLGCAHELRFFAGKRHIAPKDNVARKQHGAGWAEARRRVRQAPRKASGTFHTNVLYCRFGTRGEPMTQETVKIVAGVLAVILIGIVVLRRKSKKKTEEDDF